MSRQLTIRYDDDLAKEIDRLATSEGISRNRAVLRLLRKGTGLDAPATVENVIGDALNWFIGTWTEQQARELEDALEEFEKIDAELWT